MQLDTTGAQLEVDLAERTFREMTSAAAIAAADQAVALAQQAQDTAQKKVNGLTYARATEAFIDNLKAQIVLARQELADANRDFNHVEDLADNDPSKARAQVRMTDCPDQPEQARGQLQLVHRPAVRDRRRPDQCQSRRGDGRRPGGPVVCVRPARRNHAPWRPPARSWPRSRRLATPSRPPRPASRRPAWSRPSTARSSALDIFPGEYATPGQVVVVVSDIDHLRVETTDLSERDVAAIEIGQTATVFIEALGEEAAGTVVAISPVADLLGGDVVYQTTIELQSLPAALRSGMSADVRFEGAN